LKIWKQICFSSRDVYNGFLYEAEEMADVEGVTLSWMKSFSKNKNSAIAGSISVKDGEVLQ
jgi:hypothetical protein